MKLVFEMLLLASLIGLAWFDLRTLRVPNRVTHVLLFGGLLLQFPGSGFLWGATLLLIIGWRAGALGGGDAKLWLGLLWLTPSAFHFTAVVAVGLILLSTAGLQIGWRWVRQEPLFGIRSAGAWRTLPYVAWLIVVT